VGHGRRRSNPTPLKATSGADNHAADVSPDARRVLFRRSGFDDAGNFTHRLFVMDIDGTNESEIPFPGFAGMAAFSPDGSKIVTGDFAGRIITMNADGSNQVDTGATGFNADWEPVAGAVTITSGPVGTAGEPSASFAFAVVGGAAATGRFECRLDDEPDFKVCTSPATLSGLSDGEHVFRVRYKPDGAPAGAPAERRWVVDTRALTVVFDEAPRGEGNPASARFVFRASKPVRRSVAAWTGGWSSIARALTR
jgi:dipeptidyl aminopeptidase/acylaminoacyl peptidase